MRPNFPVVEVKGGWGIRNGNLEKYISCTSTFSCVHMYFHAFKFKVWNDDFEKYDETTYFSLWTQNYQILFGLLDKNSTLTFTWIFIGFHLCFDMQSFINRYNIIVKKNTNMWTKIHTYSNLILCTNCKQSWQ